MGCDIHMVLEHKVVALENGVRREKWVGVNAFQSSKDFDGSHHVPTARTRNYKRFGALAGVRDDGPEPKGIPSDASELTKLLVDEWGSDGHSHSWLTLTEAAEIFLATENSAGAKDRIGINYPAYYFFGVEEHEGYANFRVVFWFDN